MKIDLFALSLIFASLFLFNACKPIFDREDSLIDYLKDVQNISIDEDAYVVFHQVNKCNSCTEEIVSFVDTSLKSSKHSWHIILSSERTDLQKRYEKNANANVYVDYDFLMEKYGMAMSTDLIFYFHGGELMEWANIKDENLPTIVEMMANN